MTDAEAEKWWADNRMRLTGGVKQHCLVAFAAGRASTALAERLLGLLRDGTISRFERRHTNYVYFTAQIGVIRKNFPGNTVDESITTIIAALDAEKPA